MPANLSPSPNALRHPRETPEQIENGPIYSINQFKGSGLQQYCHRCGRHRGKGLGELKWSKQTWKGFTGLMCGNHDWKKNGKELNHEPQFSS